jgi:hypothetical protein
MQADRSTGYIWANSLINPLCVSMLPWQVKSFRVRITVNMSFYSGTGNLERQRLGRWWMSTNASKLLVIVVVDF